MELPAFTIPVPAPQIRDIADEWYLLYLEHKLSTYGGDKWQIPHRFANRETIMVLPWGQMGFNHFSSCISSVCDKLGKHEKAIWYHFSPGYIGFRIITRNYLVGKQLLLNFV